MLAAAAVAVGEAVVVSGVSVHKIVAVVVL
jgi:hypothetical protein